VLTDLKLPGMDDGCGVARAARSTTPVIVMTGRGKAVEAMKRGRRTS
jgi:FixJ family two-component response regulator